MRRPVYRSAWRESALPHAIFHALHVANSDASTPKLGLRVLVRAARKRAAEGTNRMDVHSDCTDSARTFGRNGSSRCNGACRMPRRMLCATSHAGECGPRLFQQARVCRCSCCSQAEGTFEKPLGRLRALHGYVLGYIGVHMLELSKEALILPAHADMHGRVGMYSFDRWQVRTVKSHRAVQGLR